MDTISWAAKHRPQKFKDIAGQTAVVRKLVGMVKHKEVPNAILLAGPTGCGKCVVGSSLVKTPKGLYHIRDLIAEEGFHERKKLPKIINGYGEPERPTHTYKKMSATIRVTTEYGHVIEGTPVHPILVVEEKGGICWKQLQQVQSTDSVIITAAETCLGHNYPEIPTHKVLCGDEKVKLDMKLAGALGILIRYGLDEGYSKIQDPSLRHAAKLWVKYVGLCVNDSAIIPKDILRSSLWVCGNFLFPLFDFSEGMLKAQSTSLSLVQQIQTLLLEFGLHSCIREAEGQNKAPIYSIVVQDNDRNFRVPDFIRDITRRDRGFGENQPQLDLVPLGLQSRLQKCIDDQVKLNKVEIDLDPQSSLEKWYTWFGYHEEIALGNGQELADLACDVYHLAMLNAIVPKVSSITPSNEEKWVYDFSLPKTHSFIANGVVNHNTTLARMIARYLNCEQGTACGKCVSCQYDINNHPDFKEVNASEQRGIDDVRALTQQAKFKPRHEIRVILADECHAWTGPAASAMLKPLEEPPAHTLWILGTTDPQKLLPTIVGRCTRLDLTLLTEAEVVGRLTTIASLENMEYMTPELLAEIAASTGGHMRNAVQSLEGVHNYVSGLPDVPEFEELSRAISIEVLRTTNVAMERICTKVLLGMYLSKPSVVCSGLVDASNDQFIQIVNKMIWLNQYLIDVEVLKGQQNSNVWHTLESRTFKKVVDAKAPSLTLIRKLQIHGVLAGLRSQMQTFSVPERVLATALLGNCAVIP